MSNVGLDLVNLLLQLTIVSAFPAKPTLAGVAADKGIWS